MPWDSNCPPKWVDQPVGGRGSDQTAKPVTQPPQAAVIKPQAQPKPKPVAPVVEPAEEPTEPPSGD